MDTIITQLTDFFGPFGSPYWWLIGAVAASVFFATWARAIRTLLPFIGAGTIIALLLWTAQKLNWITINWPF
jgi:hypothetical protein